MLSSIWLPAFQKSKNSQLLIGALEIQEASWQFHATVINSEGMQLPQSLSALTLILE